MQEAEANFQELKNCVYDDASLQIPRMSVIDCIYTLFVQTGPINSPCQVAHCAFTPHMNTDYLFLNCAIKFLTDSGHDV